MNHPIEPVDEVPDQPSAFGVPISTEDSDVITTETNQPLKTEQSL